MTWKSNKPMALESDQGTYDYSSTHKNEIDRVKTKFFDDMYKLGPPKTAHGVFGPDTEGCDGYIEEVIYPKEGGTFVKIYGCSYLYKGVSPIEIVYGTQLAKSLFSDFLRSISRHFLLWVGPALFFIFRRKSFLKFVANFTRELNLRVTEHYEPASNRYNTLEKEIERSLLVAIKGELWETFFKELIRFIKLILYIDNAYHFRVQDALGEGKRTAEEVLDILISRETPRGIAHKWRFLKVVFRGMCILSPALKRISGKFMRELDFNKIKMDEADWYFSLTWKSYNFKGWKWKNRMEEKERLDKLHHHVFLL